MTSSPQNGPLLFPQSPRRGTALVLSTAGDALPSVAWIGVLPEGADSTTWAADIGASTPPGAGLLSEHATGSYRRPGLRGHRVGDSFAGHDWTTSFTTTSVSVGDAELTIDAADPAAELQLRTEVQALPGGALRLRHSITNTGAGRYVVDGLDVAVPVPTGHVELLDFTGRHERERTPQRNAIRDGLWLRETRRGRTGLESASVLATGTRDFGFATGDVLAAHLGWSGNGQLWVERDPADAATLGGGELLLPGEVVLARGETYTGPWLFVAASDRGLDAVAAAWHGWLRSLPAHPTEQPVVLNVWEAVYFDHDLSRLTALAERAARVGVERFVLDDGWFLGRRDDHAGLGDWFVDPDVWPHGLHPLIDRVRELGMEFGLWFEPEMVNPDSDLFREHPDWVLAAGDRLPHLSRNQLVLDLTRPEVWQYLADRLDALLTEYPIGYIKWDHNRDLLEAGSQADGRPAVHAQTTAYYALLAEVRRRHPDVAIESCASGGGRIDLGVLEQVQRVWTSDMTDAMSRQQIQRWTVQFVAPEYLGAHVSAPQSHQTGRTLPLDFRAATALFGAFGIEWDLTAASDDDLDRLAGWVALHKRFRPLLHSGRVTRIDSDDPAVLLHGVLAADRRSALVAHVQLDESASNRGVQLRVGGLDPALSYRLSWVGPVDTHRMSRTPPVHPDGPTAGRPVSGAVLAGPGVWVPRRRPETALLVHVEAVDR